MPPEGFIYFLPSEAPHLKGSALLVSHPRPDREKHERATPMSNGNGLRICRNLALKTQKTSRRFIDGRTEPRRAKKIKRPQHFLPPS